MWCERGGKHSLKICFNILAAVRHKVFPVLSWKHKEAAPT
jgi:hypothetical protein